MIDGIDRLAGGILVTKPRCDWHECPNTAVVEREVSYKVRGESVYRTRTVQFCRPHDAQAQRTGRFTLREHPDQLDTPAA